MDQLSSDNAFGAVEFAENPEPRVPCVLVVDTSTSMHGPRIDELNKGLQTYKQDLLADPLAAKRVEVAVVTFGGRVSRLVEFVTAENFQPPKLQVIGGTPMGEAISVALDMIEERKESYREAGIAYYRPWAFLITDGEPNDHWKPIASRIQAVEQQKSFCFFAWTQPQARIAQMQGITHLHNLLIIDIALLIVVPDMDEGMPSFRNADALHSFRILRCR